MASPEPLPMIVEFPRWLSVAGIGENDAYRTSRWAAISSIVRSSNRETIETLIRLALNGRQTPAPTTVQIIRDAFYAADNNFQMQDNNRELQVLAAATLAAKLTLLDGAAAEAAIAVSASMVGGMRTPDVPIDLNVLADSAIERIGEATRKRPNLAPLAIAEAPKVEFETATAKTKENTWEAITAAFGLAATAVRTSVGVITKRNATALSAIDRFLRIQDEELQMLWWLIGERSLETDQRFDSIAIDVQPLLLAAELADLTAFAPGPRSIRSLLSRAGLKDRKRLSLKEVINVVDPDRARHLVQDETPSPVTTPIHFGITRQLETGPGDAWVSGWSAATELAPDVSLTPLAIGIQFYRERLLLS